MSNIEKFQFDRIRENFGRYGSWAVWSPPIDGEGVKSKIGDLTIFDFPQFHRNLNNNFVVVGLNISHPIDLFFGNFHSKSPWANDFKLRHAFYDTPIWGSYMTDILKDLPEKDSSVVAKRIRDNKIEICEHSKIFIEELNSLNSDKLTIIALGHATAKLAKFVLDANGRNDNLIRIHHYAHFIEMNKYRSHVLERLNSVL